MNKIFTPSEKDKKITSKVYRKVNEMIDVRNNKYPEFNNRTLVEYLNDSEKRVNSYVEDKESQHKEDWQANVALPTIRDKVKRLIAGFALTVPEQTVEAKTEDGDIGLDSIDRADIAQKLVNASYTENNNPVIDNFWESWETGVKGTTVIYEGYLRTNVKQKFIKSIDTETGEVEFDEREVNVDDRCISYLVPLTEFFIPTYRIADVQKMPHVAWVKYYDKDIFDYEFGHLKNADKVEKSSGMQPDVRTFFHQEDWSKKDRAGEERIEVIRYYSRLDDEYIIIANGVVIHNSPLLWDINGRKCYPFAKTILEPFASKHFFYGKSLPDILTGQYDLLNTYFNSTMDKGFKNLNPPTLIGGINQDAFDLEDELLSTDTKIYVSDVNQVKPMPIDQVSQADVAMIEMLARGMEDSSPSMPHLMQNKTATAREVVIAEERIREMKATYHEMLVDLWRQKFQLRLANIKTNYPQPRKIYKDGKVESIYRTFIIENTYLEKSQGVRGTLAIQFRDKVSKKEKKQLEKEMSAVEEAMEQKGIKYKKIILPKGYLDSFVYKISVIPDSVHKTSIAKLQVAIQEKLAMLAQFFPEMFMANQEKFFEEFSEAYGDDPQKMIENLQDMKQKAQQGGGQQGGPAQREPERPQQPQQLQLQPQ